MSVLKAKIDEKDSETEVNWIWRLLDIVWKIVPVSLKSLIRREWRGIILGLLLAALLGFVIWLKLIAPVFEKYHDSGSRIGIYTLRIGESKVISESDLEIEFQSQLYCRQARDSILCYPCIAVGNPKKTQWRMDRHPRFQVDQRLGFESRLFYYTIEMVGLQTNNSDTIAEFEVFQRVLPKTPDSGS